MQKEIRLEFHQNIDEIYAAYTNADFIKAKMEALGARNVEVEISKEANTTMVKIIREVQVDAPSALKSFVNLWNKMTQTEYWTGTAGGPYFGEMKIEIENAPVLVSSTMQIENTETGCAAETVTTVKSSIPFLGLLLDNFLGEMTEKSIEEEFNFINQNIA